MSDTEYATKAELAATESRLNRRIDELRDELRDGLREVRREIASLRTETHRIAFGLAALIVAMGVFT